MAEEGIVCQFCGTRFPYAAIRQHEKSDCAKRPSDHVANLPVFEIPNQPIERIRPNDELIRPVQPNDRLIGTNELGLGIDRPACMTPQNVASNRPLTTTISAIRPTPFLPTAMPGSASDQNVCHTDTYLPLSAASLSLVSESAQSPQDKLRSAVAGKDQSPSPRRAVGLRRMIASRPPSEVTAAEAEVYSPVGNRPIALSPSPASKDPFSFAALKERITQMPSGGPVMDSSEQEETAGGDNSLEAVTPTADVCRRIFKNYFDFRDSQPPTTQNPTRNAFDLGPPSRRSGGAYNAKAERGNGLDLMASRGSDHQRCRYCPQLFQEHQFAQRILHQRFCSKNPMSVQSCVFCALEFRSTYDNLAIELVAEHEDVCARNPRNICTHCGQGFGGPGGRVTVQEVRLRLENHKNVCQMRPDNHAQCRFCGQVLSASVAGPAMALLEQHMEICVENPRNSCRFCHQKFNGPAFPPEATPVARRRRHEATCPIRLANQQYHKMWSMPGMMPGMMPGGYSPSGAGSRSPGARPVVDSQGVLSAGSRLSGDAAYIIQNIKSQFSSLKPDERRAFLRRMQLEWHPDRVAIKHPESEHLATNVFVAVQKLWNVYVSV